MKMLKSKLSLLQCESNVSFYGFTILCKTHCKLIFIFWHTTQQLPKLLTYH